jgi:hypothetical protein
MQSRWNDLSPFAALALLGVGWSLGGGGAWMAGASTLALAVAVLAAVHHAEVVAHRVGEPFGTLVLAVAVTVIEVALILSMMLAGGSRQGGAAARHDLCRGHDHLQWRGRPVPAGGRAAPPRAVVPRRRHRPGLAALVALATLVLVLPTFTTSSSEGTYTRRSWCSSACRRWRCGRCSCSCRRCATATTSCRRARRPTRTCTPRRRRPCAAWPAHVAHELVHVGRAQPHLPRPS